LEAIKAYKQALRMDADNLQILRDLSLLQIQMRDLSGFVVTRNSILSLKPTSQQHWLAFALSKHLQGDLEGALQVIDIYLGTLAEGSPELERKYQPSELQMYKALLLLDKGDAKATLAHLDSCQRIVVDRGAWLWYRMQCYFAMEEWEEARKVCLLLLQRGATEDYRVHAAYQCAVLELPFVSHYTGMDTVATTQVLTVEQKDLLLQLYRNDLREEFPRSAAIARIPLTLLLDTSKSDGLTKPLDQYIRKRLIKGVPSLAMDLSSLLLMADDENKYYTRATDPADIKSHSVFAHVNSMVEKYIENLQACQNFDTADTEEQDPSIIFWAWFLQVGWLEISGDYAKALEVLTIKCLEHTPTAVDAYEVQARLLSKAGDKQAAVEAIDKGRDLDQQDRYMNNQTTKYMLQANQPETALERIGLFTNNDENTSPDKTLYDMQCSWYELELADCLARQGNYGKSLTKFGK
jgi:tetratricopeptide (TPR) repeat protein